MIYLIKAKILPPPHSIYSGWQDNIKISQMCVCLSIFTTIVLHAIRKFNLPALQILEKLPIFLPQFSCFTTFCTILRLELPIYKLETIISFPPIKPLLNCLLHIDLLSLMYTAFGIHLKLGFGRCSPLQSKWPSCTFSKRKTKVQVELWFYIWQEERFATFQCQLWWHWLLQNSL